MPATVHVSRRPLRTTLRIAVAIVSSAAISMLVWPLLTLPPRRPQVPRSAWAPTLSEPIVRGAYHVHTNRSDGSGSLDEVALAAARAGLDFVIVTDHGDATSPRLAAQYRSGVLLVDAVEISTTGGHYVALGLPPPPYPLAGEPDDVVEDVARFGGYGIAAHPDSPKRALRWRAWDAPIDGFEWVNADTEWRDESRLRLTQVLLQYPLRPVESVAGLFAPPIAGLQRFDDFGRRGRRVVIVGGTDAHARIGPRGLPDDEEGTDPAETLTLHVPSYENTFRLLTLQATVASRFTGQAPTDEALLVEALRAGRVATVVDGFAAGGRVEFYATRGAEVVAMGQRVPAEGAPLVFHARVAAPAGTHLRLRRNGRTVAESTGVDLVHGVTVEQFALEERSAAYRVEVAIERRSDGATLPWIVTNAILVDGAGAEPVPAVTPIGAAPGRFSLFGDGDAPPAWRVEKDEASSIRAEASRDPRTVTLDYTLGPWGRERWVALAWPLAASLTRDSQVVVKAGAGRPTRVSLQLRASAGQGDVRWRRSIYVDASAPERVIPLDRFIPVGAAAQAADRVSADVLLVVVDTTHLPPGGAGRVWLERLDVY